MKVSTNQLVCETLALKVEKLFRREESLDEANGYHPNKTATVIVDDDRNTVNKSKRHWDMMLKGEAD